MRKPATSFTYLPSPRLVAAARVLVGMSQKQLAEEAGLAVSSIGRYESGVSVLGGDSFEAVMGVLGRHGLRFTPETETAEMGIFLSRERSAGR